MLRELTVGDILREPVITVSPSDTVLTVAKRLAHEHIGSVVVTDDGTAVGIVTDSDVIQCMADGHDGASVTVEAVMSTPLVTIDRSASLDEAAASLASHDISTLPVTDDGHLTGIVAVRDLSYYLPHIIHEVGTPLVESHRLALPGDAEVAYEREGWTGSFESDSDEHDLGVGDVVRFRKRLDGDDVRRFAEATGDTNRVHLDRAFAERTRFGGRIVHGLLGAGMISAALARIPGLTIYLAQELSFQAPIPVDSDVEAVCRFVEQLADDRFRLRTEVRDGEGAMYIDGEAIVLIDDLREG